MTAYSSSDESEGSEDSFVDLDAGSRFVYR